MKNLYDKNGTQINLLEDKDINIKNKYIICSDQKKIYINASGRGSLLSLDELKEKLEISNIDLSKLTAIVTNGDEDTCSSAIVGTTFHLNTLKIKMADTITGYVVVNYTLIYNND